MQEESKSASTLIKGAMYPLITIPSHLFSQWPVFLTEEFKCGPTASEEQSAACQHVCEIWDTNSAVFQSTVFLTRSCPDEMSHWFVSEGDSFLTVSFFLWSCEMQRSLYMLIYTHLILSIPQEEAACNKMFPWIDVTWGSQDMDYYEMSALK